MKRRQHKQRHLLPGPRSYYLDLEGPWLPRRHLKVEPPVLVSMTTNTHKAAETVNLGWQRAGLSHSHHTGPSYTLSV